MAQETRIAAIEFDKTPTQVLLSMNESKRAEALKRQQMAFEQAKYMRGLQEDEMKRRYDNAQSVNTMLQDSKWSTEARDQYLQGFLDLASKAKDTESFEFRKNLSKSLGDISSYDRYVKDVYSAADGFIKGIPDTSKKGFSSEVFKNKYIQSALTKDGRPLTLEETRGGVDPKLIEEVYNNNKSDLYDLTAGYESLQKKIKDAGVSEDMFSEKDQKGNLRTGKSINVKWRPEFQTYDKVTGNVKLRTDDFGYLDKPAYDILISDPSVDALATRKSKEFIQNYNNSSKKEKTEFLGMNSLSTKTDFVDKDKDGLPDMLTMQDIDLVKRGFITDYVRSMPEFRKENESTTIINNNNIGGVLGNGKGYEDGYQILAEKIDRGKMSDIPSNVAKVAVQIANEQGKLGMLKGGKVQYTIKNIDIKRDADGAIRIYDKLTGDAEPISTVDPKDFNISYNNLFGDKAQAAATQTPAETTVNQSKVVSKQEFLKMNITERQKFLSEGGSYKK